MVIAPVGTAGGDERDAADRGSAVSRADTRPVSSEVVWRDLLHESARAELEIAGPFIEFGTADQHKYTRGGWGTGWGSPRSERRGPRYVRVDDRDAVLAVMTREPAREIVFRARSRASDQQVKLYWNGARLETADGARRASIARTWTVLRFEVPRSLAKAGHHQIRLEFRKGRSVADIDWLWVRTGKQSGLPEPATRMGPLRLGKRLRRALLAPTARRYSFYLHVPKRGRLAFDYGADRPIVFRVSAQTDAGKIHPLFRRKAAPGQWKSATIDLSRFSGQAIRLELATEGPRGLAGWGVPEIRAPQARPNRPALATKRPKNVVLVVYDTTRADVFSPFSKSSPVKTPHFDALAATSTAFSNAYNNESWTRPSTVTILTGLYPDTHGARYARSVLSDKVVLLSEHLSRHKFQTVGIVGNPVLRAKFGMDQGWDKYRNHGRDDDSAARLYAEAIEWVQSHHHRGQFFLYIQSHDNHTPYDPERRYSQLYHPDRYSGFVGSSLSADEQYAIGKGKRRARDRDLDWIRALYYGETTYQDEQFGRLIGKLEQLGILDETLIVVTNDHGEEIAEHGGMGHGWTLYEEQLRAPLIMRAPGLFPAGAKIPDIVEHVDVAPTIVEALGLPPLPRADGLSLLPLITGRGAAPRPYYAVAELRDEQRSIRVGRWKLIVDREWDKGWRALHDLERDPGEKRDRARASLIAGRLCEIYLGEALALPAKGQRLGNMVVRQRFRSSSVTLDDKTRRELEALGYFGEDAFEKPKKKPANK